MTKRYVPHVSLPLDPPHLTRKLATITPNSYNKFTNIKQSKINNNDISNAQTSTSVMYDSPCFSAFSTATSNTAQRIQASEVCLDLRKTERPKGPDTISYSSYRSEEWCKFPIGVCGVKAFYAITAQRGPSLLDARMGYYAVL